MTLSGNSSEFQAICYEVLIPLLVDDPLRVVMNESKKFIFLVLIPLLVDDPLWDYVYQGGKSVWFMS